MRYLRNRHIAASRRNSQRGFTLIELLVSMAVTTVILGATMAAMTNAINATESAKQITDMNNGLRTAMDLMVRTCSRWGRACPAAAPFFCQTEALLSRFSCRAQRDQTTSTTDRHSARRGRPIRTRSVRTSRQLFLDLVEVRFSQMASQRAT